MECGCKNKLSFLPVGVARWPRLHRTCRSGGIGRRAWFRSMYPQGCGGSSPFFGTKFLIFKTFFETCRLWLRCPARLRMRRVTSDCNNALATAFLLHLRVCLTGSPHETRCIRAV